MKWDLATKIKLNNPVETLNEMKSRRMFIFYWSKNKVFLLRVLVKNKKALPVCSVSYIVSIYSQGIVVF